MVVNKGKECMVGGKKGRRGRWLDVWEEEGEIDKGRNGGREEGE